MRHLIPAEIAAYDLIDAELARRVRIRTVPVLAPGTSAMTLGRLVLMRRDDIRDGSSELMAHELVHVRQFAELGWLPFLARYLGDYLRGLWHHRRHRAAYLAIPLEIEARAEAAAWRSEHRRGPAGNPGDAS